MKTITVTTLDELEAALAEAGTNRLYRGQTRQYGAEAAPSVTTSFDRLGCIPTEMGKWTYYASNVLEGWYGAKALSHEFSQAVLQHYGWRTFFVDATSKPAVAAWFASHVYSEKLGIDMSEDYHEDPIWLRKKRADYTFEDGTGFLFVLKKPDAGDSITAVDLSEIHIEGARPRPSAQAAWLVGPLHGNPLPPESFVVRIAADRSLFRAYALKHGLDAVETLFPTRREDPILNSLLYLPWTQILGLDKPGDKFSSIPAFRRTIEFPEYDHDFGKIQAGNIAFYQHAKASDFETIDGAPAGIGYVVPDVAIYGRSDPVPTRFPRILELVRKHGCVTFEVDNLIRHQRTERTALYGKGVSVVDRDGGMVEVAELLVEHPGRQMTRVGINQGWFYSVDAEGEWTRTKHAEECGCGNNFIHERHMSALGIIEQWLEKPEEFSDVV